MARVAKHVDEISFPVAGYRPASRDASWLPSCMLDRLERIEQL